MTALDTLLPFDRLFGSYVPARSDLPCLYGWTKALSSYKLRAMVAKQWHSLNWEAAQAPDKAEVLGPPLMSPDWPHTDRFRAAGEDSWQRHHAAAHAD